MGSDAQLAEVGQGDLVVVCNQSWQVSLGVQDCKSLCSALRFQTPWLTDRQTDAKNVCERVTHHFCAFRYAISDQLPQFLSWRQRHLVGVLKAEFHYSGVMSSQCLGVTKLDSRTVNQTYTVRTDIV